MREILFRGKREDNGEWVYGCAFKKSKYNCYYMITNAYSSDRVNATGLVKGGWEGYENVISETVGQYTGLTDKNDTKIFEGDIIHDLVDEDYGVVRYNVGAAAFELIFNECVCSLSEALAEQTVEVSGNIHDSRTTGR